jgi:hypothetical protein
MNIAHIAHTEYNLLALDDAGLCVRVESRSGRKAPASDDALRCIGAQFVASIDPSAPGGLAHRPRVGASMLLASVDANGRVFCLRVGPLTHFESTDDDTVEGPGDSGVYAPPSEEQRQAIFALEDATEPYVQPELDRLTVQRSARRDESHGTRHLSQPARR